jgi:hypothetical protein
MRHRTGVTLLILAAALWADEKPAGEYEARQWRRLPLSSSLWSLLGMLGASSAAEPPYFGGFAAALLPYYASGAGSWTRTGYQLNGLDLTDPYQPGRPVLFPHLASAERIIEERGAIRALTRSAEGAWRVRLATEATARALAGGNLSALAKQAGLLRPEQFRWLTENRLELGGGLGSHADLFVSAAGRWASQSVPREPVYDRLNTRLLTGSAAARVRPGRKDRVRAAFTGTRIHLSGFGAPAAFEALVARRMAPPFEVHPLTREDDRLDSVQAVWSRELNAAAGLELRYGYGTAHFDTTPAAKAASGPRIDLVSGLLEGDAPLAGLGARSRHAMALMLRREGAAKTRLSAEIDWQRAAFRNRLGVPGDRHRLFVGAAPVSLVEFNTPLDSRGVLTESKLAVAASWEARRWFSLGAGVAVGLARGSLPEQSSPEGSFRPARRFPARPGVLAWNDAAPWLAVRLTPFPGRLSLTGHYRRSLQPVAGRYLDHASPNSLSGLEYRHADGVLLRRFGGEFSAIDPRIRRPYTDEFGAAANARLPGGLEGRLRLFRRDDRRRLAAINIGIPFSAYRPVPVADPGGDSVAGTFDDQTLFVWEQDPRTFGEDRFLLTNTRLGSFSAGLVAELRQERSRYWWRLSFAAEKGYATTNPGNAPWENDPGVVGSLLADPNTLLNATGRIYFDRAYLARLYGGASLPRAAGGLEAGWVVSYWDGLAFGRRLLVEGLAQGPLMVMATPRGSPEGGHRTKYNLSVDLRLSRRFALPGGGLRIWADIFNLPNLGYATRERDTSGPEFNLRLPVAIQPPRFLRLGLEYEF